MSNQKKILLSFFISILTLFFSSLRADIVNKIIVEGNSRVSEETIKIYGEIELNTEFNEKKIDEILNNLYSTEFFEDVKIKLNNNILEIQVKEYPVINQIFLVGEQRNSIKEQILKNIKLKQKRSFIKSYLVKDIEKIKNLYSSIGFNFVKVETKINKIDEKNLDLLININKGNPTKISSISFTGDKKVREKRLRE